MSQDLWSKVDQYLVETLIPTDSVLEDALKRSNEGGLPPIAVAPNQGMFLHLLAKAVGAKNILEIGTLGGYSTICLGRALPSDGRLVTCEFDPKHAKVAKANIAAAGLDDRVEVYVGPALETLPQLTGPFDFCFIDADKVNNPKYFKWALDLSRPGTVIVFDNVVRFGEVIDADSTNPLVQGARNVHELIAAEPRVQATALQTVGVKGHDGFTMVLVTN